MLALGTSARRSALAAAAPPPLPPLPRPPRAARLVIAAAAKKEKKGGKAQKKGGGALAELLKKKEAAAAGGGPPSSSGAAGGDALATREQWGDPDVILRLLDICSSYKKAYDEYLMETGLDQLAEAIYKAPFVLLSHNKFEEGVDDPVFVYANRAALELWEGSWGEIVGLPSRRSAEDAQQTQEDRNQLLERAASSGAIRDYEAWRVSLRGTRFRIKDVKLFNVAGMDGTLWGQAAVFSHYEREDGTVVRVPGEGPPPSSVELPPSEEEVQAAEAAVAEQAAAVRELKEGRGLANQDPAVQEAVAELQRRKQAASELQDKFRAALAEAEADAAAPPTVESVDDEER